MSPSRVRAPRSRSPRTGAFVRSASGGLIVVLASLCGVGAVAAQEPPDTVPRDTVRVPIPDTPPDTLAGQRADTVRADSLSADSVFYNAPRLDPAGPAGWARGVWEWSLADILAVGANTLVELVAEVPGLVPLRGGDYGTPLGLTAFGAAGGALRILVDGFEMPALGGGVPDLTRIGLGGIEHVRIERNLSGLVIHMRTRTFDDRRASTLMEVGTGDLDTNLFRGTFANPRALGGSLALALERVDTEGPFREEPGQRTGSWVRYQLHRDSTAALAVDFRRMSNKTELESYATEATRTDWNIRGRAVLAPGLTAEAYWGRSGHDVADDREAYVTEGGKMSQTGLRLDWQGSGVFAQGAYRRFGNEALPGNRVDALVGGVLPGVGGASLATERAAWSERSTSIRRAQLWTEPRFGLSAFASWESGTRGARTFPLLDQHAPADPEADGEGEAEPEPEPEDPDMPGDPGLPAARFVDRTASRVGAAFQWRGIALSAARLRLEADSLLPTGLPFDREQPALPGGERSGWEGWGRLPIPLLDGLYAEGSLQQWDQAWSYLPERVYRGAFVYHGLFKETGNLELWVRLGVRGRDAMDVRILEETEDEETGEPSLLPVTVPFYQNWYANLQVRVVTVRVFIAWENFTVRRNLQDVPGRILPRTRAMYGIRWMLWN